MSKLPGGKYGTAAPMPDEVVQYYRSLFVGMTRVLDVGCGKGDFLWNGAVGIDLDVDRPRLAGKRVVVADLTSPLPFKADSFDGALAKDIIEHIQEPRTMLQELQRVARPGARLVVVTPRDIPRAVWADYTHVRGFTKKAIRTLLADTHWRVIEIRRMGAVPLAGRLRMVHLLPTLLRVPVIGHYFGTNWQIVAVKKSDD